MLDWHISRKQAVSDMVPWTSQQYSLIYSRQEAVKYASSKTHIAGVLCQPLVQQSLTSGITMTHHTHHKHWLRWASWLIFSSSNYYSHFSPRFLASSQSKGVAAYSWATQRHGDERIPAIVIESFFHQQQNPSQCSNNIWLIIYNYKHFNFEYPHFTTHFEIETASWSNLFASTVQSFQACSMTSAWSPCKDPLSLLRNYEWETDSSNATQLIYTWHNLGQCNMTMTMTIIILQTQTMIQKMRSSYNFMSMSESAV